MTQVVTTPVRPGTVLPPADPKPYLDQWIVEAIAKVPALLADLEANRPAGHRRHRPDPPVRRRPRRRVRRLPRPRPATSCCGPRRPARRAVRCSSPRPRRPPPLSRSTGTCWRGGRRARPRRGRAADASATCRRCPRDPWPASPLPRVGRLTPVTTTAPTDIEQDSEVAEAVTSRRRRARRPPVGAPHAHRHDHRPGAARRHQPRPRMRLRPRPPRRAPARRAYRRASGRRTRRADGRCASSRRRCPRRAGSHRAGDAGPFTDRAHARRRWGCTPTRPT